MRRDQPIGRNLPPQEPILLIVLKILLQEHGHHLLIHINRSLPTPLHQPRIHKHLDILLIALPPFRLDLQHVRKST